MPKEKPILFSTPMVQAILEGRKTMTRRVVKGLNDGHIPFIELPPEMGQGVWYFQQVVPKYQPGDILWVREATAEIPWVFDNNEVRQVFIYKADNPGTNIFDPREGDKWQPSIFMPRVAARLFLEVKAVRIEQLRSITCEDKVAEGFCDCHRAYPCSEKDICAENCFMKYWDSLNAKRGYSWDSNPWVWVYEFMRIR